MVTDLLTSDSEYGKCDRCGRTKLRFIHTVEHPDEGRMQVGCECAKHLCFGYNPVREEIRLRNLHSRSSRWLNRMWVTASTGNDTLKFNHEREIVRVTVFPGTYGGFVYCIAGGGEKLFSSGQFATKDEAKFGAFDRIADLLEW